MATLLLSAAGAALGSSFGGSVLGLSASVIGRAAGATLGRVIDARIMGAGSPTVETGRIDRFRVSGASEGAPMAKVHGRVRIAGQVIWSSRFLETVTTSGGGGKGSPSAPTTRAYSYSVSLAIALADGEISRVGRVWADGNEISKSDLNMRVYKGTEDQLPDAKIEAVEGADEAPAYRGTAYVVIEDLQLAAFGNRVPQFSFEVMHTGVGDLAETIGAVAMIPGTGEYALATTPVHFQDGPGKMRSANQHVPSDQTDFSYALQALDEELPTCGATSLVVSWFGDDLRCGSCRLKPKVEQTALDGVGQPWRVSGVDRASAETVAQIEGRPVYGGTPSDASVIEAITALQASGKAVMFYPFILMEQLNGNGLLDPWSGAADQPVLPWRGRITTSLAPDQAGTVDGTAAATSEVDAFFGSAVASEFQVSGDTVFYAGADGFSYRRFILHYAHLCALAGGVESFCIGSEMRGLTQIRGTANAFPAVDQLRDLAAEVRSILGAGVKIGYAADWTEYFGYQPQDGSGDVFFHLDPLWADNDIDFIGIDNYMPLSDWRDGADHADIDAGSLYDLEYLKSNISGGEGYDWYYGSDADAALQIRTPITDGAYGEPWVFRYKDLHNWWGNPHFERISGVKAATETDWQAGSKPIWFTEIGCAAIDKGTNQPNKFLDPKSSESQLPKYSSGGRDDLMQMQYLRALSEFWSDPANNPNGSYGGPMVATDRMFAWAWDARPYPYFPGNSAVWGDGDNYARGHWLNGRVSTRALSAVIKTICADAGVTDVDVSQVYGLVRGYALEGGEDARTALQPLLLAHGVDAIEKDGTLFFRQRDGRVAQTLAIETLAEGDAGALVSRTRLPEAETSGRVRLGYVEADGDYEVRATEGIFPDEATTGVAQSELAMSLTAGEADNTVERWLAEARVARDTAQFALPPSSQVEAGDIVALEGDTYRIDRIEDAGVKQVDAVRVEAGLYRPAVSQDAIITTKPISVALPVWAEVVDLPLLTGTEVPYAPMVVASGDPWPGQVAVYSAWDDKNWTLETVLDRYGVIGQTLNALPHAQVGAFDRGAPLIVQFVHGALSSIDESALFAGGNAAIIGTPGGDDWEVFQFRDAVLIGPDTWALSHRLRGQRGSDGVMPSTWSSGSTVIVLDEAFSQIEISPELLGLPRKYRIGNASKPVDHTSFVEIEKTTYGIGQRPYAPAHLRAASVAGDLALSWVRRTRTGGDTWGATDVPLGELNESYLVRVLQGDMVLREETVSAPTWSYSSAQQATDGVSAPLNVEVAQVSDLFGPGLFARIVIDG